jgi:hypothetical protein
MKIGFGRKQLVVSWHDAAPESRGKSVDIPYAIDANDNELARLNISRLLTRDRAQWETNALLYGAFRLLEA